MKVKQMKQGKDGSLAEPDFGNGGNFHSRVGKNKTSKKK